MFHWKRHSDPRTESLATIGLFEGLTPRQLADVGKLTTQLHVRAGQTLCEEGHPGDAVFIIERGEVDLSNGVTLRRGDCLGEMALVTKRPRSATAVTRGEADVLVLSPREFSGARDVDPRVAARVDELVRARLRRSV